MRTGDTVFHRPSGERWLVACVHPERDEIYWMGWPPGCAKLSDCDLITPATDAEYRGFLQATAEIRGNDHRGECAKRTLATLKEDTTVNQALTDILAERARQDAKWGEQNHDPFTYLAVLVEEVGELAQAALHTQFGGPKASGLREEAIHTAAVALAIVECLDRDKWRWGGVQS